MTRSLSSSPLPDLAAEPDRPARPARPFEPLFSARAPKWETLFGTGRQPANDAADLVALEEFDLTADAAQLDPIQPLPTVPDGPPAPFEADAMFGGDLPPEAAASDSMTQLEHQAIIEDLTKQYEDQIAELQETDEMHLVRCLTECGDGLKIAAADLVENAVAKALAPIMDDFFETAALAAFAEELGRVVRNGGATRLLVRGGEASLEKLKQQLGDRAGEFRFEIEERAEVLAEVDETVISTCVQKWRERLAVND